MTKFTKIFYAAVFCFALSLCGALFAACAPKEESTVNVSGRIVFESRNEYNYDTDITLSFNPNEGELNAPASLSYRDPAGRSVTAEGFTLVQSGESYSLLDENGQRYALDLVWNSENSKDDHVTVYGDFVADKSYAEYEEHREGERFLLEEGHYGAGKLDASGKQWRFRCEPIRLSDGSELCIYAEADSCTDAFVHKQYGPLQFFTQETADGDFLIYEYWLYDNDKVCVYFECHNGEVDWESASRGWHGIRYTKDGQWGTDMFYHMSEDDPVFDVMFAFGPMVDGEVEFFEGADIVKNASGDFTVRTDEGAWHVTLQYGGPEVRLIFTVEEIQRDL